MPEMTEVTKNKLRQQEVAWILMAGGAPRHPIPGHRRSPAVFQSPPHPPCSTRNFSNKHLLNMTWGHFNKTNIYLAPAQGMALGTPL